MKLDLKASSIILRYGVIAGLIIVLIGIATYSYLKTQIVIFIGTLTIALTPLISLTSICIIMAKKRRLDVLLLSLATLIIILISIITSLD